MSNLINVGTAPDGGVVSLDLTALAEERLLVQGTSGSGKSGLLRRILEQSYGQIPQIVIDTEGEFATLRAKFPDYVLAAHEGGDTLAAPHTAAKLARELNALNVSAILDISELDPRPRLEFVALYVTALINLPRANWKPVMLVVDECHEFAPENGSAVSLLPIERAASKGRKRGVILVCATTRVSDLSKSVTALLNNKLIGKTQQDTDVRRAAFELGIAPREATAMLRDLKSRNFVGFGGAFRVGGDEGVDGGNVSLYVSDTATHPPVMGELVAPKAPTARMRSALAKLSDLPREAEREIRDLNDAKVEIGRLGRELKAATKAARMPVAGAQPHGGPCAHPAAIAALELQLRAARADLKRVEAAAARAQGEVAARQDAVELANRALSAAQATLKGMAANLTKMVPSLGPVKIRAVPAFRNELIDTPAAVAAAAVRLVRDTEARAERIAKDQITLSTAREMSERAPAVSVNGSLPDGLRPGHREVLVAAVTLAAFGMEEVPISAMAALSKRAMGGGFQNLVTDLANFGLVDRARAGVVRITDQGRAAVEFEPIEDGEDLRRRWSAACSNAARQVLAVLIDQYPNEVAISALAERTGRAMGGGFQNLVGELCTKRAATRQRPGYARAADILFPEGA